MRIDHPYGVDSRLRHQQPSVPGVQRHPYRHNPTICLEAGNSNRYLAHDALCLRVDNGHRVVVDVGDKHTVARGEYGAWAAAPLPLPRRTVFPCG